MGDWHKVELQEDIDFLMETYGGFHDSCIVSLSFQSGAFVDNDMAMHFGGPNERILSVICQSQWEPKTIELQFSGLRQMHIVGWQDNYLCLILDAYLAFHNGLLPGQKTHPGVRMGCGQPTECRKPRNLSGFRAFRLWCAVQDSNL